MDVARWYRCWVAPPLLILCGGLAASAVPAAPPPNLSDQERLIEAEVRNHDAQAGYYRSLGGRSHDLSPILPGVLGFLGVIVGAAMSFFGLSRQAKSQERMERNRWQRDAELQALERDQARADRHGQEVRLAAADFAKLMAKAAHSMAWVTWVARNAADHFSSRLVEEHNRRMDSLYSEMMATQILLATLSPKLYRQMWPLAETVRHLDGEIARQSLPLSLPDLGRTWLEVHRLERELPETVLGLLRQDAASGIG